jgi:hypothetical protein
MSGAICPTPTAWRTPARPLMSAISLPMAAVSCAFSLDLVAPELIAAFSGPTSALVAATADAYAWRLALFGCDR